MREEGCKKRKKTRETAQRGGARARGTLPRLASSLLPFANPPTPPPHPTRLAGGPDRAGQRNHEKRLGGDREATRTRRQVLVVVRQPGEPVDRALVLRRGPGACERACGRGYKTL